MTVYTGSRFVFNLQVKGSQILVDLGSRILTVLFPPDYQHKLNEPGRFNIVDPFGIYRQIQFVPFEGEALVVIVSPSRVSGSILDHFDTRLKDEIETEASANHN